MCKQKSAVLTKDHVRCCPHFFHDRCIKDLLNSKGGRSHCPLCRQVSPTLNLILILMTVVTLLSLSLSRRISMERHGEPSSHCPGPRKESNPPLSRTLMGCLLCHPSKVIQRHGLPSWTSTGGPDPPCHSLSQLSPLSSPLSPLSSPLSSPSQYQHSPPPPPGNPPQPYRGPLLS